MRQKKITFLFALLLLNSLFAFAQEDDYFPDEPVQDEPVQAEQSDKKVAISLGVEWNLNSNDKFSGGATFGFDYNLSHLFAVGFTTTYTNNFSGKSTIEPAALFRWYFRGKGTIGFFAQADLGACIILEEGKDLDTKFLGGLRGGVRLAFGSLFFVEPYGRAGYPFMFSLGVLAGLRF